MGLSEKLIRGIPDIHSFISIVNAPKLTKVNIYDYRKWVDSVIRHKYIVIQKLVVNIEMKSIGSVFGKFFTNKTIIEKALADSVLPDVKLQKMQQRNNILKKVKNYIDNELNPSKKNFLDSTKEDYEELKSIDEILASLEISKHDYEEALYF